MDDKLPFTDEPSKEATEMLETESLNCSFSEFLVQWKWYPQEQSCQASSGWFLRLWTWQKTGRFFSSRWLIFGEWVASPSYIPGQCCTMLTQPHVDVIIFTSKAMTSATNTWSFHDSFLDTLKHKYNGNGATPKLSYLIKDYGDRDVMKLRIVVSLLLFYGSSSRSPEFRTMEKKLQGLKLELKDEVLTSLFAGTRNENVTGCGTTVQAREEVVSSHVEIRTNIEMFQSKAWIFKYSDKRQERDRTETQQQALTVKLGQSRCCREVQKLKVTSMAGIHVRVNNCFTGFCVNGVFHLQRPPEILAEKDQQRCYDGLSTKFLSSLRTRMFSTKEYCDRINWLSFWFSYLISLV